MNLISHHTVCREYRIDVFVWILRKTLIIKIESKKRGRKFDPFNRKTFEDIYGIALA